MNDGTFSSLPEEKNSVLNEHDLSLVSQYLSEHIGRVKFASQIAKACGFPTDGTCVKTRKCIKTLIEQKNMPIIATSKGFMLATTVSQMQNYLRYLIKKQMGLDNRIRAVHKIIDNMESKKMQEEFGL